MVVDQATRGDSGLTEQGLSPYRGHLVSVQNRHVRLIWALAVRRRVVEGGSRCGEGSEVRRGQRWSSLRES